MVVLLSPLPWTRQIDILRVLTEREMSLVPAPCKRQFRCWSRGLVQTLSDWAQHWWELTAETGKILLTCWYRRRCPKIIDGVAVDAESRSTISRLSGFRVRIQENGGTSLTDRPWAEVFHEKESLEGLCWVLVLDEKPRGIIPRCGLKSGRRQNSVPRQWRRWSLFSLKKAPKSTWISKLGFKRKNVWMSKHPAGSSGLRNKRPQRFEIWHLSSSFDYRYSIPMETTESWSKWWNQHWRYATEVVEHDCRSNLLNECSVWRRCCSVNEHDRMTNRLSTGRFHHNLTFSSTWSCRLWKWIHTYLVSSRTRDFYFVNQLCLLVIEEPNVVPWTGRRTTCALQSKLAAQISNRCHREVCRHQSSSNFRRTLH